MRSHSFANISIDKFISTNVPYFRSNEVLLIITIGINKMTIIR